MDTSPRIDGFHGEFLWELEIARRQIVAMAEAIPDDKYAWRPDESARSIAEVFMHVAAGSFMVLEFAGVPPPADLYGELPVEGAERFMALIRRNDELEKDVREKAAVTDLLKRSLRAVEQAFVQSGDTELNRCVLFFGERTSVRRVYLRLLAHTHEHMGQMIAYTRVIGLKMPWADWRPDRRPAS